MSKGISEEMTEKAFTALDKIVSSDEVLSHALNILATKARGFDSIAEEYRNMNQIQIISLSDVTSLQEKISKVFIRVGAKL